MTGLGLRLVCVVAMLAAAGGTALAEWFPEKPIELVVMAGKGGGADKMARMFTKIIENEELLPVPVEPVNMPGKSGAEALEFMRKNTGNPYVMLVTLNSFYTAPLLQPDLKLDVSTFTPVGRMAEDTFLLWVKKDRGIATLEDFVAAARKKGKKWLMAGTGTAQEDEVLTEFLNQTYGLGMSYKAFKGGGDVADELAEGRADSTVNNPSEQEEYYFKGISAPVVAFTPERLDVFKDVPTFKEKGKDLVYFMQRSVVGPPGLDEEVTEFYRDLFRLVYESKEWQDYMNRNSLRGEFVTGEALRKYWAQEQKVHEKILAGMGKIN